LDLSVARRRGAVAIRSSTRCVPFPGSRCPLVRTFPRFVPKERRWGTISVDNFSFAAVL
jgi:hypothetical protein